jgi:hypothetical protein
MPKPRKSRAKYTSVTRAELIERVNRVLAPDHRKVRATGDGFGITDVRTGAALDGFVIIDVRTGAHLEWDISRTGLTTLATRLGVLDLDKERVRG